MDVEAVRDIAPMISTQAIERRNEPQVGQPLLVRQLLRFV